MRKTHVEGFRIIYLTKKIKKLELDKLKELITELKKVKYSSRSRQEYTLASHVISGLFL